MSPSRSRQRSRRSSLTLNLETLESRLMPAADPFVGPLLVPGSTPILSTSPNTNQIQLTPITPGVPVLGNLKTNASVDFYTFRLTQPGLLHVEVNQAPGSHLDADLRLMNNTSYLIYNGVRAGGGGLLLSSDDRAPGNPNPLIEQFTTPGVYELAVSSSRSGASSGAYLLQTRFQVQDLSADPVGKAQPGVITLRDQPVNLAAGDFNRDGIDDIVTVNRDRNSVTVLLGIGDATFHEIKAPYDLPDLPQKILTTDDGSVYDTNRRKDHVLDVNGDHRPDLAVLDHSNHIFVLLGLGDGTFRDPALVPNDSKQYMSLHTIFDAEASLPLLKGVPLPGAPGDYNRDGLLDVAVLVPAGKIIPIELHVPERPIDIDYPPITGPIFKGPFHAPDEDTRDLYFPANESTVAPFRADPQIIDLDGDKVLDDLQVTQNGDIIFRRGEKGRPGVFGASAIVNSHPGDRPARAITLVHQGSSFEVAAIDIGNDTISRYGMTPEGWIKLPTLQTSPLGVRIDAEDVNGDGLIDLITDDDLIGGTLKIYLRDAHGNYPVLPSYGISNGPTTSKIIVTDLNRDGKPDIVLPFPIYGAVGVLIQKPSTTGIPAYEDLQIYRAGPTQLPDGSAIYGLFNAGVDDITNGSFLQTFSSLGITFEQFAGALGLPIFPSKNLPAPGGIFPPLVVERTLWEATSATVGDFNGDGYPDLIVTNRLANAFTVQLGKPGGTFSDPLPPVLTGDHGSSVVESVDFNKDGHLDLAILNEKDDTISIFKGDGQGHFSKFFTANVGNAPSDFTLSDADGDGNLDLMVGSGAGDMLTLRGRGDGTFEEFVRAERNTALIVTDVDGDGHPDVVFSNEARDSVQVQYAKPGENFEQNGHGVLGPRAVQIEDLTGDDIKDLIVANGGGNNLLVFPGLGNGQFGKPMAFFAGTDPVSLTLADVNLDKQMDVVVTNHGSNDVSVLLGNKDSVLIPGPRLDVGHGPTFTEVEDFTGSGWPDLLVSNGVDGTVMLLPAVGGGFFNDHSPQVWKVGANPMQVLTGNFDRKPGLDLVTINADSNDVTYVSDFIHASSGTSLSAGDHPMAALAGDFNRDGLQDLLIVSNGDNSINFFGGEADGLKLLQTLSDPSLQRPTALAISAQQGNLLDLAIGLEGSDSVLRLSFSLDGPGGLGDSSSARTQVTLILPVQEDSLAVAAVVLTGSLSERLEHEGSEALETVSTQGQTSGAEEEPAPADRAPDKEINPLYGNDWEHFLQGPGLTRQELLGNPQKAPAAAQEPAESPKPPLSPPDRKKVGSSDPMPDSGQWSQASIIPQLDELFAAQPVEEGASGDDVCEMLAAATLEPSMSRAKGLALTAALFAGLTLAPSVDRLQSVIVSKPGARKVAS